MQYYTIAPPAHLASLVRFFWVLEGDGDEPFHYRSMADGSAEMLFHYHGCFDELKNDVAETGDMAVLHAQSRVYRRFVTPSGFGIFGVYLYPFAIAQIFGVPASAVSNELVDLPTLLGATGARLVEQMMLAKDTAERITIATRFIEQQLLKHQQPLDGVAHIITSLIQSDGRVSVDQLASQAFLSVRQFERKFKDLAGFSPKLYTRIIRFQTAVNQYDQRPAKLSDVALQCGYYDQSHFIHDFKEFYGYHPSTYFQGGAEGAEYRR